MRKMVLVGLCLAGSASGLSLKPFDPASQPKIDCNSLRITHLNSSTSLFYTETAPFPAKSSSRTQVLGTADWEFAGCGSQINSRVGSIEVVGQQAINGLAAVGNFGQQVLKIPVVSQGYYRYPAVKADYVHIENYLVWDRNQRTITLDNSSGNLFDIAAYRVDGGELKPLRWNGKITPFSIPSTASKVEIYLGLSANSDGGFEKVVISPKIPSITLYNEAEFPAQ